MDGKGWTAELAWLADPHTLPLYRGHTTYRSGKVLTTELLQQTDATSSPVSDHFWRVYTVSVFQGPLILTTPLCVGAVSTGGGFDHHWGRNGEFCVAVGLRPRLLAY